MLIAGSDDGAYRLSGDLDAPELTAEQVLDAGRARRVRTFDAVAGVFAATTSGLFHSPDGETWTDLGVPEDAVYAVGTTPDGDRLYAGTRPARVYTAPLSGAPDPGELDWRECEGFQDLPSREEWRLPRHENLAQVRDVHVHPEKPERVVAGVEVGGVHASEDGGDTWTERRGDPSGGVDDDVHELRPVGADEWVAATGFGLYRTTDAGASWERLDGNVEQRYFRAVLAVDGTVYAAGALANSSTWDDPDADPQLFASRDGDLAPVTLPTDGETVTGLTVAGDGGTRDGDGNGGPVVAVTHRGSVVVRRSGEWVVAGELPVREDPTGRYTPLAWTEN